VLSTASLRFLSIRTSLRLLLLLLLLRWYNSYLLRLTRRLLLVRLIISRSWRLRCAIVTLSLYGKICFLLLLFTDGKATLPKYAASLLRSCSRAPYTTSLSLLRFRLTVSGSRYYNTDSIVIWKAVGSLEGSRQSGYFARKANQLLHDLDRPAEISSLVLPWSYPFKAGRTVGHSPLPVFVLLGNFLTNIRRALCALLFLLFYLSLNVVE
jgi:hypothetical protein